jgi:hypothetical protein
MPVTHNSAGLALLVGAVSGVIVLGIIGRAAMAVVAFAMGVPTNLSLRGVFEVVVFGGLVGAVGGLLLLLARKILPAHQMTQSALVALVLLGGSITLALYRGRISLDIHTALPLTLSVAAIVFVVYGHVTNVLLGRLEGQDHTNV